MPKDGKNTAITPSFRQRLKLANYSVEDAGGMVGWGRSESYRRADAGFIPTRWYGRFRLVPRRPWDRKVRELLEIESA
jgi:hypothetical protein